ncbi:TMV resistance protein N-like [Trifolium medium]|uniref:TMV resistance protein N-like n=1 Tax=Trifolium medium TaxID=97028 RepID=A0A392NCC3_9FABA|nr:TMV resistance protein N-like [Trifolium medium]
MSSSISSSSRSRKSDVFLSYHDKDTCKSFASDLYSALTQAGLVVDINHNNLTSGDQTNFSAIEASRTSIIIFSSNFDASTWFLEELEQILECGRTIGQVVLPVFYVVDPSDVRRQVGIFGKAFEDLIAQRILTNNESMRYKEALIEASSIAGFLVMSSR